MSLVEFSQAASNWIFLSLIIGIPGYALLKNVKVYESFIEGAQEGFQLSIRIVPYLVAMLVAIGMLRASGAFELLASLISPVLSYFGMPAELLPLALIRPFSGSAANGVMAELITTHGGDSLISQMAATVMGSTETTFYVIAVYFGAAKIRRTRHAIPAGLIADLVGIIAAVWICRALFAGT
jgi:spore maturation protein B